MVYTVYYLGIFFYCYHFILKSSYIENEINLKALRLARLAVGLLFQRSMALISKLMVLIQE